MKILFIVPGAFGIGGGISRYCQLVCKVLSESPEISHLDIIARNDAIDGKADAYYLSPHHSNYYPAGPSKIRFLAEWLKKTNQKYDVYLSGHANLTALLYPLRLIHSRSALVSFAYGIEVWNPLSFPKRYALAHSDLILSISHFTASQTASTNQIHSRLFRILHNCLDPQFSGENIFPLSHSLPPLEHTNFLTVARLDRSEKYKGHDLVIQAMPKVLAHFPNAKYYIVGTGDLIEDLRSLTIEHGVASNVHFLGYLTHQELVKCYEQCDVFIMPSRKEGFGYVFAEAMAYGKPVIAGNQDATVEVVKDGETGILVNPTDISELSAAMIRLLSDADLRQRMGQRGRERVLQEFSYEQFKTSLLSYLQEAVSLRRKEK